MTSTGAELLAVGGHHGTIAEFLPFLSRQLEPKLAGTFVVDPSTMTPGRVREQTEQVVQDYERQEERRLVAEVLDKVGAGGRAAIGLEWCLLAVNEKAVQLLLVYDDEQAEGRVCDNCGWLGLDGDSCPVCDSATRKTPDVIDEMAASVVESSGRVEHVYPDIGVQAGQATQAGDLSSDLVAAFMRVAVTRPES